MRATTFKYRLSAEIPDIAFGDSGMTVILFRRETRKIRYNFKTMRKLAVVLFWLLLFSAVNAGAAGFVAVSALYDRLPPLREITDYRPRLPLRIHADDGVLIGEFGEEKRVFTPYDEFPPALLNAVLATEDAKFFRHPGLDFAGFVRAALGYLQGRREGASTITMQVAGNFYLNRDRSLLYKISQILLALKIERQFSKEAILELYMNQIYLGGGAFGFGAAARAYYGKLPGELDLAEIAVLAGLPKAPSRYHPGQNPERAKSRQRHVLNRMRDTGLVSAEQHRELSAAELPPLARRVSRFPVEANFFAEEVRKIIHDGVDRDDDGVRDFNGFGEDAYQRGFRVRTTLDSELQAAAVAALRNGLLAHESRRPYPGPEKFLDVQDKSPDEILSALKKEKTVGDIPPAVVLDANRDAVLAMTSDGERHEIRGEGLKRAAKHLPGGKGRPTLARGAVVRVMMSTPEESQSNNVDEAGKPFPKIISLPRAEAALVALSPEDGAILAMAGGFDFSEGKFNHATQAKRQPGSAIKPFIYSAALERGMMPSAILYDSPQHYSAEETGGAESWEPRNYDRKAEGPMRMRVALNKSKNLASIGLLKAVGPEYALDFIRRFGLRKEDHPPYLSLALGSGAITPLELARGFAVFASGGFLPRPYFIKRVEDYDGNILTRELDYEKRFEAIDSRNAFIMTSLLKSVVREGTGRGALSLERNDLAGKTGTTNDTRDAWFAGYAGGIAAVAWIGNDDHAIPLGDLETGGRAALPIWREFMATALRGRPEAEYPIPSEVVAMRIRKSDGKPVGAGESDGMSEFFYAEFLPAATFESGDGDAAARDELF